MTASGFQNTGWHWTRKGWKRTPKHLLAVKKVPLPTKRKTRKKTGITTAAPREKPPTFAEARKLAAEPGESGFRTYPSAGGREASAAPIAEGMERQIRRPRQAIEGGVTKQRVGTVVIARRYSQPSRR
jgi:hypothetical protein